MEAPSAVTLQALEEVAGPAIVLDQKLRVVGFTPRAEELVGTPIQLGDSAPRLLCGSGPERPVAEALARGESVSAEVLRPWAEGETRMVQIRATPLQSEGEERAGWLLLLDIDEFAVVGPDAVADSWGILTRDAGMKQLLRQIARVARTNASVLIRGETGTGKELVARAIHQASSRRDGPFLALNCAALPPNLLESELFGHVRGAFTGAVRNSSGHFRAADGGTLFLDEVAELPLEVQAKLLRVLQEKTVIPVGGTEPLSVDTRIVAATHRSLRAAVAAGEFRADLMYRLRVVPLFLPPLRDRPRDIELLAHRFVEQLASDGARQVQHIAPAAVAILEGYGWPGNVRELRNVIEYALVMGDGPVLLDHDLPAEVSDGETRPPVANLGTELPSNLSEEGRTLLRAIERAGGHHGRAAQALGLSRVTLWRKLRRLGLDKAHDGETPPSEPAMDDG